jgi:geranylgeranyl reductase
MEPHASDVVVVGGGPAGAWCAMRLARAGARVVLLDRPRTHAKTCGGCLTAPAWDELGRPEALRPTAVHKAVFEWARAARAEVNLDGGAVLVERDRLDAFLLDRAGEAGARLVRRCVRRIRHARGSWTVETDDGEVRGGILVGADGCRSIVRAALVGPLGRSDVAFGAGLRAAWSGVRPGATEPGTVRAVFHLGVRGDHGLPRRHGYAYAFGAAEGAVLGVWGRVPGRAALALLRHMVEQWLVDGRGAGARILGRSVPCVVSPAGFDRPTAGDTWLLVGDAAGHVNPVTGEGIRYALRGGRLAARAILDGRPISFHDRWEADFGSTLRWGARLVRAHERVPVLRWWIEDAARAPRRMQALADVALGRASYRAFFLRGAIESLPYLLGR